MSQHMCYEAASIMYRSDSGRVLSTVFYFSSKKSRRDNPIGGQMDAGDIYEEAVALKEPGRANGR